MKYYVLLPTVAHVGTSLDNVQWETILRSVSAQRSFRWLNGSEVTAFGIAEFLILDMRMPRSLAFCYSKIVENLGYLAEDYGIRHPCHDRAEQVCARLKNRTMDSIFESGLHEFVETFLRDNNGVGAQIETDYLFRD